MISPLDKKMYQHKIDLGFYSGDGYSNFTPSYAEEDSFSDFLLVSKHYF